MQESAQVTGDDWISGLPIVAGASGPCSRRQGGPFEGLRCYALTESLGADVPVDPTGAALEAAAGEAACAGAAECPPPWPPDDAIGTLEVEVEMPRSVSTSLTLAPVLLAITETLSPCRAIC